MNKSKLSLLRGDQMKANDQEEGDEEMSSVMGEVTQTSQIEAIAKSLPTLYHVRCAYCPYECLLFKTSLLNTLYKSPFDEHREKYASQCPIFALNSDLAGSKSTSSGVDLHRDLAFNSAKGMCIYIYSFEFISNIDRILIEKIVSFIQVYI